MAKKKQVNFPFIAVNFSGFKKQTKFWFQKSREIITKIKKAKFGSFFNSFSAPFILGLLSLLLIISFWLPKLPSQKAKEKLILNRRDFEAHLALAEEYLKNNQIEAAEKELWSAQDLQPHEIQLRLLWQKKMSLSPDDIGQLIEFWQKIVSEKPFYRDGYLQLTVLSLKIGKKNEAQKYLQEAINIDPNFEPALELKNALF